MISIQNQWIVVAKDDKVSGNNKDLGANPFLSAMGVSNSYGIVQYENSFFDEENGDFEVCVGDKVYFGKEYQIVTMEGREVFVMKPDNIIAFVINTPDGK